MPKFTIAIPVYNCDKYIDEAIESVLSQPFSDYELLIVDNASTDDTGNRIKRHLENSRVRIIRQSALVSITENWNTCIRSARGDWLCILGADDILLSNFLCDMDSKINESPDIDIVSSAVVLIDSAGTSVGSWSAGVSGVFRPNDIIHAQLKRNLINVTSCVMRLRAIKGNEFSTKYPILLDYEFFTRCMASFRQVSIIETPLAKYRVHGNSGTAKLRGKIQWFIDERCLKTECLLRVYLLGWVSLSFLLGQYVKLKFDILVKSFVRLAQAELSDSRRCLHALICRK